ncbi:hypothetical protein CP8484711_1110A, partial [Chlamydia psittaci 84-8471/1]
MKSSSFSEDMTAIGVPMCTFVP